MKASGALLISAIICFVFYDIISTIAAFNYLGTFQYESSALLKYSFGAAGIPGFILLKATISTVFLLVVYLHVRYSPKLYHAGNMIERIAVSGLNGAGMGILAGATLAGIFVGTSNLNIVLNGSSLWLMGLDSSAIPVILIMISAGIGFLAMSLRIPINNYLEYRGNKIVKMQI